jgi:hypothetical protein
VRLAPRPLRGLGGEADSIPNVGLEPTPTGEERILSPARLPSLWYWADVELTQFSGICQGFTLAPAVERIVAALG